ncbi:AlbA family DNA-binding domain-containing protein [Methanosarcina mazei]|uniref:ATPase AAA n=1 Tax=Methanosarcina mazei TaxID=2209 RepID=A0A0F8LSP6_METMZ|nr:helix-turn-helix domain-containing protein [Methanosarcina mazei]KKG55815.1 ATPase AAA [Methanosarcina mazei]KKG58774.1 ATPase AAA [Methanosarcina mazei]KKG63539.1 ATPase AAA [Methanosarcina mazei]KKH02490.1 ATPase AAA [Methanosarcina mazei]KKH03029.1 ATPase AAA [Methanosarcina mazei]
MTHSIAELLSRPEGKTLEFKRDLSSPRNILKTLVAFANTAGGRLLIGVEDGSRELLSIENPLDEEERVCSLIADNIEPRLVPNVELIAFDNKTLLGVEVYPSGSRPHWLKKEGPDNGVYVRLGSSNRKADSDLIQELRRSAMGITFDEQSLPDRTVEDLDFEAAVVCFERKRKLVEKDLESLRLVTRHQGHLVPTVGGMLLFGKDREIIFPDAWIQCGRFIGKDKADIFDHTEIHEHLPVAVERVMEFLKKHAMRGADFSELRRRDVWSIPLTILREAVINAVVHADYSQKGAPIRVSFFDNRIEIENPGILLPGLTVEDMLQGVSKLRNRVIARVFRELDLIEQWGSGVSRMFKEAKALGLPEPEIIEVGMRVRFIVHLAESIVLPTESYSGKIEAGARLSTQSPTQSPTQSSTQSYDQVQRLLLALKDGEKSPSDLRSTLNIKHRPTFRDNYLHPALNAELIEMTIPEKPTSNKQKYRLTAKGKAFLDKEAHEGIE